MEIYELFTECGININKDQIKLIFKVVDNDGSGSLTREEFIDAAKNEQLSKKFTEVMRGIKFKQMFEKKNRIYK